MRRILLATVAAVALVGAGLLTASDTGPGPIPVCNGEQATIVLVKYQQLPGDSTEIRKQERAQSLAPYQEWIDAGVDVQVQSDNFLVGTTGHDVMVSLVSTFHGGFVAKPHVGKGQNVDPATAGDFMCSFRTDTDDVYYATIGFSDFIFDAGGSDEYRLGGCALEGEGSPGNRGCDEVHSLGPVGPTSPVNPPDGRDRVWGFKVPRGRIQIIESGDAWLHAYVGKGPGKVVVHGGGCFIRDGVGGTLHPCTGNIAGNGDHVHPCPVNSTDLKLLPDGVLYTKNGITVDGIEAFGDERDINPAIDPAEISNPCKYQQVTL